MEERKVNPLTGRISFASIRPAIEIPDLLNIQVDSFEEFLQANVPPSERKDVGLQAVFNANFPILDTKEFYRLDFIEYYIERPRFSIWECEERGLTYAAPLKAKLRLSTKDEETGEYINAVEQEVYLGNLPFMTERGTFMINGAERVIVSQLHRSPGVAFSQSVHPNGTPIYSARIIPFRGSWVEFATDINHVLYIYVDRRKKFPSTALLRALGYVMDEDILNLFNLVEVVQVSDIDDSFIGRVAAADVIDSSTGEIYAAKDGRLDEEAITNIKISGIKSIKLISKDTTPDQDLIINTLIKDSAKTEEEALFSIYRQMRSGEVPDVETAKGLLDKTFFNDKRYDLGEVGRFRMNDKLSLNIPLNVTVLTIEDIVAIMKNIIALKNGTVEIDDIDHLGNRRIRTVGEQLGQQYNVGLARMARTIRERMNVRDNEVFTPIDLINSKTLSSVINSFFGTNQLSQFMDQTNPLGEMTHKRRLSALGPGGLSRERAGFEVRDVHYTHYGRLCPIETPEGPNIGLISSLCVYAKINELGFIETPYRNVKDGVVDLSNEGVFYLSAEEEEGKIIAQANAPLHDNGKFVNNRIKSRLEADYPLSTPEEIDMMDVAPNQITSIAASLIPFLEHDDANRALMGSNMMRQSVPLLKAEAPIVGTGIERQVIKDSRIQVSAEGNGIIEYVDANEIRVRYDQTEDEAFVTFEENLKTYSIIKFRKTNQNTCINLRPIVKKGERVVKDQSLTEGYSTQNGELAIGKNLKVAFMPWKGYNFEDAIVISERIVREDILTSIHIDEHLLEVRDTKRGLEEFTSDIPNVSEEAIKNLDENGLIRVGANIKPGDILIGKITPKGESDPSPEEKLLRAIFGDKAGDVKDASLKARPSLYGTVIDKKLFTRTIKDRKSRANEKPILTKFKSDFDLDADKLKSVLVDKLFTLVNGKTSQGVKDYSGNIIIAKGAKFTQKALHEIEDYTYVVTDKWTTDISKNDVISKLLVNYCKKLKEIEGEYKRKVFSVTVGDELPAGIMQLAKVYIAQKRKLKVGDKMAGRHGNKGIVSKVVRDEDMPFLEDGTIVDIVLNPLGVPSRMNLGQIYETVLGWAGKELGINFATPIFDGATLDEITEYTRKAGIPDFGKTYLHDGGTGEKFDQPATVGIIYMLKLGHLIDDKMHARSIGPYSLITQQPLGGKAQFGGQRFGEMEVWAIEAFGASNILQEILTLKSDDVYGRAKAYESIVKGEPLPIPGLPESFNVLLHELRGLGLNMDFE